MTQLVLLGLLIYGGSLAPVFVAIGLVIFKGKGVPGRWLFLIAGPLLSYTIIWLLTLVFVAPAWILMTLFFPAVVDITGKVPYWVPIANWLHTNAWWLASTGCLGLATWLGLYVWPRWPELLGVMTSPPRRDRQSP